MVTPDKHLICGLIGEKLSHSFSKLIHNRLGNYQYDLIELNKIELVDFLKKREFHAVNVTIPYKEAALPLVDFVDESAREVGSINTIVNRNDKLYGYNTDVFGFIYCLNKSNIELKNKKLLILGSGGTCKTVSYAAKLLQADEVFIVSRTKSDKTITYEEIKLHYNADVIINTTPVGMFPQGLISPVNLEAFNKLDAVVDVIYNPLNTKLLLQAKHLNINYTNGLYMLIAQAKFASEYFFDIKIPDDKIEQINKDIIFKQSNLVLIGMPTCGKSTLGRMCAQKLNRQFIDTDALIEQREQMSVAQIFALHGEEYFRRVESDIIAKISKQNSAVIATGGGVIKNAQNIENLRQNGVIAFIDRPLSLLKASEKRPLASTQNALEMLYLKRHQSYINACDFAVLNDCTKAIAQKKLALCYSNFFKISPEGLSNK